MIALYNKIIVLIMSRISGEAETHRFYRYAHNQGQQGGSSRQQIIPNRILLSDHSTITPIYQRKKKKFPLFTLKSPPRKQLPSGNIFTNRGIIAGSSIPENERRLMSSKQYTSQTQRKKTESSLSLFNKLILTPFNFVRPRNAHSCSNSSSTLKQRKNMDYTRTTNKLKPQSAERSKGRPSPYRRTLEQWCRSPNQIVKSQQRQQFIGWQTSSLQGEQFLS